MALPRFQYNQPAALSEACEMLQAFGDRSALLAGGTDLLVKMKNRTIQPEQLISLAELEELGRMSTEKGLQSIGACCTISKIADSEPIRSAFPALASSAGHIGSPAVRNLGTVGGNVVTASPAADLPPALIAYGARALLTSPHGERTLPLEELFRGPGITDIQSDEILTAFLLERPPDLSGAGFFKLGNRKALQISIVNGCCFLALDPQSGKIHEARIALGAVAPIPVRAVRAEKVLMGETPGQDLFSEAGRMAAQECHPIDDLRGTASYREDMVRVLTSRTLTTVLESIRKSDARH